MMWTRHLILISLLTIGCGSSGDSGGKHDAGTPSDTQFSLPEIPPGCPPSAGNDNGIGKPCTATGTECTGGLQCSCKSWFGYTMPASMPCFCTSVTFGTTCSSCGTNAPCCTYDIPINGTPITISACFPAVCAPNNQCPALTP